ncbi:MAG: UDP-N-acetylglucosamine 2-epimerase [Epulopiscium sp. Nuni2H_MBin001]|nr:MAG: UDP-N-acetylglucosamine 2-epimerase [Epulopiscium sp. Nuni2H_MBin001]
MRALVIFGTRPEAIKMAPVIEQLRREKALECLVCITAQHREMLDGVLSEFGIDVDFDLNIMQAAQSLAQVTTRVLEGVCDVIKKSKPDIILVHGDTTTTFAAALAAFYERVPVGHVEAGLRTYNKYEPFPEEVNRLLTSSLATLHFAPTENARLNLIKEGIADNCIFVTGNTVVDTLKLTTRDDYVFKDAVLNSLSKRVVVVTSHRRENLGQPLIDICDAICKIVSRYEDVEVVFPVHKNPAVRDCVFKYLDGVDRVILTEPLDTFDMHNLLNKAFVILTDSGGLQEEAPSFKLPVLVLRNVTERPEGVEAGVLKVIGTDTNVIVEELSILLEDNDLHAKMACGVNPYGDGFASQRIVTAINQFLQNKAMESEVAVTDNLEFEDVPEAGVIDDNMATEADIIEVANAIARAKNAKACDEDLVEVVNTGNKTYAAVSVEEVDDFDEVDEVDEFEAEEFEEFDDFDELEDSAAYESTNAIDLADDVTDNNAYDMAEDTVVDSYDKSAVNVATDYDFAEDTVVDSYDKSAVNVATDYSAYDVSEDSSIDVAEDNIVGTYDEPAVSNALAAARRTIAEAAGLDEELDTKFNLDNAVGVLERKAPVERALDDITAIMESSVSEFATLAVASDPTETTRTLV